MTGAATLYRPARGKLRVQTPYAPDNRAMFKQAGCRSVTWQSARGRWIVPRARFVDVLDALRERWDVRVIIDGLSSERCDTRCVEALGDECVCSCGGANHGGLGGSAGWVQVGDTTLISTGMTRAEFSVPAYAGVSA